MEVFFFHSGLKSFNAFVLPLIRSVTNKLLSAVSFCFNVCYSVSEILIRISLHNHVFNLSGRYQYNHPPMQPSDWLMEVSSGKKVVNSRLICTLFHEICDNNNFQVIIKVRYEIIYNCNNNIRIV